MAFGTGLVATLRQVPAETVIRVRIWSRVLGTSLGVAALAGAGQLGIAYGFGLVRFARSFPSDGLWSAQLTWVVWFAALASLAGAAAGARTAGRYQLVRQLGRRIIVAGAAGLGALVVVPLTALPADSAELVGRAGAVPSLDAALAAGLGMVVGVLAAVAVLSVRLVAVSVTLLVAGVWLVALVSVAPSLAPTADLPEVRLGVLDLPALGGGSTIAVLSAPILTLLVCGAVAAAARSRGLPPLPTAVASTAAPGLLALVYLVGSPGTGDRAVQAAPYAGALIAVAGGLLVSLGVGVVRGAARAGGALPDPEPAPAAWPEPPRPGLPDPAASPPRPALPDPAASPPRPALPDPAASPPRPALPDPAASPPRPALPDPAPTPPELPRPVDPEPAQPPTSRRRLPRIPKPRRKPRRTDPVPDSPGSPAVAPPSASQPAPSGPVRTGADEPAPTPSRRRGRRREDERNEQHVDWISSLSGQPEPDELEPGRRRLRRDRDEPK
jgi:hypothetical protein